MGNTAEIKMSTRYSIIRSWRGFHHEEQGGSRRWDSAADPAAEQGTEINEFKARKIIMQN